MSNKLEKASQEELIEYQGNEDLNNIPIPNTFDVSAEPNALKLMKLSAAALAILIVGSLAFSNLFKGTPAETAVLTSDDQADTYDEYVEYLDVEDSVWDETGGQRTYRPDRAVQFSRVMPRGRGTQLVSNLGELKTEHLTKYQNGTFVPGEQLEQSGVTSDVAAFMSSMEDDVLVKDTDAAAKPSDNNYTSNIALDKAALNKNRF